MTLLLLVQLLVLLLAALPRLGSPISVSVSSSFDIFSVVTPLLVIASCPGWLQADYRYGLLDSLRVVVFFSYHEKVLPHPKLESCEAFQFC